VSVLAAATSGTSPLSRAVARPSEQASQSDSFAQRASAEALDVTRPVTPERRGGSRVRPPARGGRGSEAARSPVVMSAAEREPSTRAELKSLTASAAHNRLTSAGRAQARLADLLAPSRVPHHRHAPRTTATASRPATPASSLGSTEPATDFAAALAAHLPAETVGSEGERTNRFTAHAPPTTPTRRHP
jgi:hypothetical protein